MRGKPKGIVRTCHDDLAAFKHYNGTFVFFYRTEVWIESGSLDIIYPSEITTFLK
jgi:hypothetical protein